MSASTSTAAMTAGFEARLSDMFDPLLQVRRAQTRNLRK
jgi:hypothetical protein